MLATLADHRWTHQRSEQLIKVDFGRLRCTFFCNILVTFIHDNCMNLWFTQVCLSPCSSGMSETSWKGVEDLWQRTKMLTRWCVWERVLVEHGLRFSTQVGFISCFFHDYYCWKMLLTRMMCMHAQHGLLSYTRSGCFNTFANLTWLVLHTLERIFCQTHPVLVFEILMKSYTTW